MYALLLTTALAAGDVSPAAIELTLPDAGESAEFATVIEVTATGWLHAWAASDELDPDLMLLGPDGSPLGEDASSGGGTTAFLQVELDAPGELLAIVTSRSPGATGTVRLHLAMQALDPTVNGALYDHAARFQELVAQHDSGDARGAHDAMVGMVAGVPRRADGTESVEGVTALDKIVELARVVRNHPELLAAEERLFAHSRRIHPPTHPDHVRRALRLVSGRLQGGRARDALALQLEVLADVEPLHADDDWNVLSMRKNAAWLHFQLGEFGEAARIYRVVATALEDQGVPATDARLADTRQALGAALSQLARHQEAVDVFRRSLEELATRLPADHALVDVARENLGLALVGIGRADRAIELHRTTLANRLRTLPANHPNVIVTRRNLASALGRTGEHEQAWRQHEAALEALLERLPADHFDVQRARIALATSLRRFGDLQGSREVAERAVEVLSDYPDASELVAAQGQLAVACFGLGDHEAALEIQEALLERLAAERDPNDRELNATRLGLASTLGALGDAERALELTREHAAVLERTLPPEHVQHALAAVHLARWSGELGHDADALDLLAGALPRLAAFYEPGATELRQARRTQLLLAARLGRVDEVERQAHALARGLRDAVRRAAATRSPREAGELASSARSDLEALLLAAAPSADASLRDEAFATVETLRCAELLGPAAAWLGDGRAELEELRADCRRTSAQLAFEVGAGSGTERVQLAREARDAAWRALVAAAGASALPELTADAVRDRLPAGVALVSYVTTGATEHDGPRGLLAQVVRGGRELAWVRLGELPAIEESAASWRAALRGPRGGPERGLGDRTPSAPELDERASGAKLRELVVDPLREHLDGARRVVFLLDGPLEAVPLDALPLAAEGVRLGDELGVSVRATSLELLVERAPVASGRLVVAGGIDYDGVGTGEAPSRAGAEGFPPLPGTAIEARRVAELFPSGAGDADDATVVLRGGAASRERLMAEAPRARWLHLATHGWFEGGQAPNGDPAGARRGLADAGGLLARRVVGSSPLVLAGLALSGANRDREGGTVTAEELSALDLAGCELAALSACDTGVGVDRTGRGAASLRLALHMAGVRSALTSLWKVDDVWTQRLMEGFYRGLWVEGLPKAEALWLAKRELRRAGAGPGDWAGWVLSGDSD